MTRSIRTANDWHPITAGAGRAFVPSQAVTPTALVFVDPRVDGWEALVAGMPAGTGVILLDPAREGGAQIADALAGLRGLAAIHIVSHGSEGRLALGATALTLASLPDHAAALGAVRAALAAGGDLLLYGCDVGGGAAGAALLAALAEATDADVAASIDATGAAGDWHLEAATGAIEAQLPFTAEAIAGFTGTLALPTVTIAQPAAAGGEVLVNTTTTGDQGPGLFRAVAALSGGGYVVTWYGNGPGDADGIFLQRYSASGTPLGSEVRVNTTTTGAQDVPSVAGLSGGDFVVTWVSAGQDGSLLGVYAQRYNASGVAQGGEVRVNTTTTGDQRYPSIAALSDGGYVVAWDGSGPGDSNGIWAQRFDASGAAVDAQFRVNTTVSSEQAIASVAGLAGGGFVVAWRSNNQDGSNLGIYQQRYDASGVAVGGEVPVNTTTTGSQADPVVAALSGGGYVVTWMTLHNVALAFEVHAQQFDASGAAVGGEFRVNTTQASSQANPSIAALNGGGYAIVWSGNGPGDSFGAFAQCYDASGAPVGGEVRLNTTTDGAQAWGSIAGLSGGGFVGVWGGDGPGDAAGVFAQRFAAGATLAATEQIALSLKGAISVDDADGGSGVLTVTLAVDYGILTLSAGTSGATIVSGNATGAVVVSGTLEQLAALLDGDATSALTYRIDDDTPPATDSLSVSIADGSGTVLATETVPIGITPVNDAPSLGANGGATLDEGASVTITAAMLDYDDLDHADTAITYRVTSAATNGELRKNGAALGVNGTFTQDDIGAGRITYLHDGSNTTSASFGFSVADGAGEGATGQSFAFTIDPLAPALANLEGDSVTFVEDGTPVLLDASGDIALAGVDPGDFSGGSLHVAVTGNKVEAEDRLQLETSSGPVAVSGGAVTVDGVAIGALTVEPDGDLHFVFNADATADRIEALVTRIGYSNSNHGNPSTLTRTVSFTLEAAGAAAPYTLAAVASVNVDAAPDATALGTDGFMVSDGVAQDLDVHANDIADFELVATAIDGTSITVGGTVTLASGAKVTLNSDGTLRYDPGRAFDHLVTLATATELGLFNVQDFDAFTYTAGGESALVTVAVAGTDGIGDELWGNAGDNDIGGRGRADLYMLGDGGSDTASGGGGEDGFYMGTQLDHGDVIDGGTFANTFDQLGLQGNYDYTFSATNLVGIEILVLLSGRTTAYGDPGGSLYTYDLTTIDANVAAGRTLTINGNQLYYGEDVFFDGSAETDGSFNFSMSGGDDVLIGGALADQFYGVWGQDTMTGGGGNDVFHFRFLSESTPAARDSITDFTAGDRINFGEIDPFPGIAGDQRLAFIGSGAFTGTPGQLRVTGSGNDWLVEVDVNGDGVADVAVDVTTTVSGHAWSAFDFGL